MMTLLSRLPTALPLYRTTTWNVGRLSLASWTEDDVVKATKILNPSYSGYKCFIKKSYKDLDGGDFTSRSQKISAEWKALHEDKRKNMEEIVKHEKVWAQKVVDEADPKVLAEVEFRAEKKNLKLQKFRLNKLEKVLEKPIQSCSGFNLFLSDNIPLADANVKILDRFTSTAKLWKSQPDSVKEKYKAMASTDQKKFWEDLKKWKLKVADNAELKKASENVKKAHMRLRAAEAKLIDAQISK